MKNLQKTILGWLRKRLDDQSYRELETKFNRLKEGAEDWEVFSSFSAVPRYTGKKSLDLDREEIAEANELKEGWQPEFWTVDQLGRTLMVLAIAERGKEEFLEKLEKIFISSDMGEAVALYQSLAILPYPEDLQERAAEGIRSNITSVFNAVALRNPYPANHLGEDAWNQMVLKALFVGSPLYLIQGIDERSNGTLARMLVEYAHERWAAGRVVSPELWRPAGPFIDQKYAGDIEKNLSQPEKIHQFAAVLALKSAESEAAEQLLDKYSSLFSEAEENNITWEHIGREFNDS